MNKIICILIAVVISVFISGCTNKTAEKESSGSLEETTESSQLYSGEENKPFSEIQDVSLTGQGSTQGTALEKTQDDASVKAGAEQTESARVEASTQEKTVDLSLKADSKPTEKEIQQALKNVGLYKGKVDGEIGPKTKEAIKVFQEQNNLAVDGKVGSKTWQKLYSYLNKTSTQEINN